MRKKIIIILTITICLSLAIIITILTNKKEKTTPLPITPTKYLDKNYNLNLIKTVNSTQKDNYLISPYSIEIALKMLKDGAANNTKAQIEKVIGTREIPTFNVKNKISVTNATFIKNDYKDYINNSFYNKIKNYQAEIIYDEFNTPDKINAWVKKNTYDMISKIMDEISADFVLGIANAVAIDVNWLQEFECLNTISEEFTKEDNSKINVEMMHNTYEYNASYFKTDKEEGVVLPYATYDENGEKIYDSKGTTLEFIGILPNTNITDYIDSLTLEQLQNIDKEKKEIDKTHQELYLSLPRFSYEFNLKIFKEVLATMGIKDVFNPEKADLSDIISRDNMKSANIGNLYVDQAIHKTYIDLNEKGTKAAAITYFGISKNSALLPSKEKVEIKFNKPFIYMIREKDTKEILFFGVVKTPNLWKGSTCEIEQ